MFFFSDCVDLIMAYIKQGRPKHLVVYLTLHIIISIYLCLTCKTTPFYIGDYKHNGDEPPKAVFLNRRAATR